MNGAWQHYGIQFGQSQSTVISALLTLGSQSPISDSFLFYPLDLEHKALVFLKDTKAITILSRALSDSWKILLHEASPAVLLSCVPLTTLLWTPDTATTLRLHLHFPRHAKLVLGLSTWARSDLCSVPDVKLLYSLPLKAQEPMVKRGEKNWKSQRW